MAYTDFPAQIASVIEQKNLLERAFHQALQPNLAYRFCADVVPVEAHEGETITKSRVGLRPTITTPLSMTTLGGNTTANILDNGVSPSFNVFEQYTVTIQRYGDGQDLDLENNETLIANLFVQTYKDFADQAGRSLDGLCAQALHTAYEAGNTWITATASASATTVHVDNINGFDTAFVYQGNSPASPQAVSVSNPVSALYYPGGNLNLSPTTLIVTGVSADGSNSSTSQSAGIVYGRSGNLTLATNSVSGFNPGDAIVAKDGAFILRAGSVGTRYALSSANQIVLQTLVQAKAKLEARGVKPLQKTGRYLLIVDPLLLAQLWNDQAFQRAAEGGFEPGAFKEGVIRLTMGMDIVTSNFTPVYALTTGSGAGNNARHGIVVGEGALVEAPFVGAETAAKKAAKSDNYDIRIVDGIVLVSRAAMDRFGLVVSQGWKTTLGYVAPTDVTTNPTVIPGSDYSRYKRAVLIEGIA